MRVDACGSTADFSDVLNVKQLNTPSLITIIRVTLEVREVQGVKYGVFSKILIYFPDSGLSLLSLGVCVCTP